MAVGRDELVKRKMPGSLNRGASLNKLIRDLQTLIREGRHQVLRAVDTVQVGTCWEIGRHIAEFEQGGEARR